MSMMRMPDSAWSMFISLTLPARCEKRSDGNKNMIASAILLRTPRDVRPDFRQRGPTLRRYQSGHARRAPPQCLDQVSRVSQRPGQSHELRTREVEPG